MSATERWLIVIGSVGLTASAAVAALVWLLVTRPIAVTQYLAQVL
jgi:hypothetical protein